jgi:hypothetical protein
MDLYFYVTLYGVISTWKSSGRVIQRLVCGMDEWSTGVEPTVVVHTPDAIADWF